MANFSPYADYAYISIIPEVTAGTPITPTNYLRYISDSMETSFGTSNVMEIAGSRERNIRSVANQIEIGGDVEFYVESKMIGHFLRGLFWVPTTQVLTANTSFRHCFTVTDTPKTFTVDIKPADAPWVHRYFGVQITAIAIEPDDNKIKCTVTLAPRKAFIVSRVTTAVSSGTALAVDQTAGLTTADSILILNKADGFTTKATLTISAIPSDTSLTVSTIGVSIAVDDLVVIKKASTVTYNQDNVFTWLGWSQVYSGADIDNTTAQNQESFSLEYKNETEAKWFGGLEESSRFPGDVITKWYSGSGKVQKFYDSESNIDKMRKNAKSWLRILMQGETALESNSAVAASSTWGASNGFTVTAATAWKAGNDINVTLVIASSDNLSATESGNNVTVFLANTTASKNTGTLIAAAVNALTIVNAAAAGTGATQFTVAEDNANLGFKSSGTNIVGRDASEKPYLQFDHADARIDTYFPGWSEDDILMEEVPFTFFQDVSTAVIPKKWSTRVFLVNSVSSY